MRRHVVLAWFVVALCAALVSITGSAFADEGQTTAAREKFREATLAHERGEYRAAAELFEEAHRLLPAAGAKFNAGIAWDESGEPSRAADDYETALEMGGLTEDEAKQAEERLLALRKTLGYLSIDAPIGATVVVDETKALVPVRIHLTPGEHRIDGTRGATTKTFAVDVRAGEVKHISLDFPEDAKPAPPPSAVHTPVPNPSREHAPSTPSSAAKTWGFVALGAGVVFSGAAIVLGVETLKARDAWDASGHTDLGKRDNAVTLRAATNVAWGGAIIAGVTGTVLLLSPVVRF